MAEIDPERVRALCLERVDALQQPLPVEEDRVVCIVQANIAKGRFQRFAGSRSVSDPAVLSDYVDRVLFHVCSEYSRIRALEKGDPDAWKYLGDLLARRAFRMIQHFRNSPGSFEAPDFAHDACLVIFEAPYPFDVAFEAWAFVILKNLVIARCSRSGDILDRGMPAMSFNPPRTSGEETFDTSELLSDERSLAPFGRIETESIVRAAIERLRSRAQRQVIIYTYFEGLSDAQIASRLHRSKQAVYNLRNRALVRLKDILSNGDVQENSTKKH